VPIDPLKSTLYVGFTGFGMPRFWLFFGHLCPLFRRGGNKANKIRYLLIFTFANKKGARRPGGIFSWKKAKKVDF